MSEALADCVIARHRKRLHGAPAASPSIWTRPDDPRTASNSSPFSIATTIATVICRWSAFSPSTTRRNSILVAAVLRPGNVSGSCGAIGILRRLLRRLDSAFPGALFRCAWMGVCGAGGSGVSRPPASCGICREPGLQCGLDRLAERPCVPFAACPRKVERPNTSMESSATDEETWKYERRILYKAEVTRHPNRDPKDNPRFVVTNMNRVPDGSTRRSTANAATWKSH